MCEANTPWDVGLPENLKKRWDKWMSKQSDHFTVECSLAPWREPILEIILHAFRDASTHGVGTVV